MRRGSPLIWNSLQRIWNDIVLLYNFLKFSYDIYYFISTGALGIVPQ